MKTCVRCGKELTKYQRKYCCECAAEVFRERSKRQAKERRERGEKDTRTSHKKKLSSDSDHLTWEADICLNCKRGRCINCLSEKTREEKEQMLKECGGKKWLD